MENCTYLNVAGQDGVVTTIHTNANTEPIVIGRLTGVDNHIVTLANIDGYLVSDIRLDWD